MLPTVVTRSLGEPGQPALLHLYFEVAPLRRKDAPHRKAAFFQQIGKRCISPRITGNDCLVDVDNPDRKCERSHVVNALTLDYFPDAAALFDEIVEAAVSRAAETKLQVLANYHHVGFDDCLAAV